MSDPHVVIARFHEHIEPLARGERYEDPLHAALEQAGLGRVTGGGSALTELGAIEYVDVEIEIVNLDAATVAVVSAALEQAGAPVGSELLVAADGRRLAEFGRQQILAIFLDGATLPDAVYAELDFDATLAELESAIGPQSFRGFWQGPEETGLFFGGSDATAMFASVEPLLRRLPIGQNARVVVGYGKPSSGPIEHRIPRQSPD
jgi:hypothetical protein